MGRLNFFTPRQVYDRARQLHALRAMICLCGQIELCYRRPHEAFIFRRQLAKLPNLAAYRRGRQYQMIHFWKIVCVE
jgi:hypothetical protein